MLCTTALTACSSGSNSSFDYEACYFPDTEIKAPKWVCDEPVEGLRLQASGIAEKSGGGIDFMKTMATATAKDRLAQMFTTEVQSMVKSYVGTTGRSDNETADVVQEVIQRQITHQVLEGVKIQKSFIGPDKRMYVLVGMSEQDFKSNAKATIESGFNSNSAEWQRLQADKGFKELTAELNK